MAARSTGFISCLFDISSIMDLLASIIDGLIFLGVTIQPNAPEILSAKLLTTPAAGSLIFPKSNYIYLP